MHEAVLVGEAVAGESAKIRAQLAALIGNINKQTIDVAELLHKVKSNGYYQDEFPTFKEFTESIGLKARKAQYLTKIVETCTDLGIDRKVYEPLGIAKLREITSLDHHVNYKNPIDGTETPMGSFITSFVEQGADMELDDLKKSVRTLKGLVGENDIEWVNVPFIRSVYEKTIQPALELARANIGSVGKDDEGISQDASTAGCMEVWAVEYLNDPANTPGDLTPIEESNETL